MRAVIVAAVALLGSAQGGLPAVAPCPAAQVGEPINAKCPVKPNQKSRPNLIVVYEGQVIGFC